MYKHALDTTQLKPVLRQFALAVSLEVVTAQSQALLEDAIWVNATLYEFAHHLEEVEAHPAATHPDERMVHVEALWLRKAAHHFVATNELG